MSNSSPHLPLDVFRETLNHLGAKDLLKCQQVCGDFRQLVQDSSALQLRMHLEENGIQPTVGVSRNDSPLNAQSELERLRAAEETLSKGDFAYDSENPSLRFRDGEVNSEAIHLLTIANGYLFTPWNYHGNIEGMGGIARYQLSDLTIPPVILRLDRAIRHYQVDPAEGLVLVVILEDE